MDAAQTLAATNRRFTGHAAAVERAFEISEPLSGLCRDSLSCAAALARWHDSDSPEARALEEEDTALLGGRARSKHGWEQRSQADTNRHHQEDRKP